MNRTVAAIRRDPRRHQRDPSSWSPTAAQSFTARDDLAPVQSGRNLRTPCHARVTSLILSGSHLFDHVARTFRQIAYRKMVRILSPRVVADSDGASPHYQSVRLSKAGRVVARWARSRSAQPNSNYQIFLMNAVAAISAAPAIPRPREPRRAVRPRAQVSFTNCWPRITAAMESWPPARSRAMIALALMLAATASLLRCPR